jgi:hypothetical protein
MQHDCCSDLCASEKTRGAAVSTDAAEDVADVPLSRRKVLV